MLKALLNTIREACSSQAWSQGVLLARHGAVVGEEQDDDEIILRVSRDDSPMCFDISLWPEFEDWSCNCPSTEDACKHVAAAIIALSQAKLKNRELPTSNRHNSKLRYCLERSENGLVFDRFVVTGDEVEPLRYSLAGIIQGEVKGPSVLASKGDLGVDRVMGYRLRGGGPGGAINSNIVPDLFKALSTCKDVRLDGEPIKVSDRSLKQELVVRDHPEGFWVQTRATFGPDSSQKWMAWRNKSG